MKEIPHNDLIARHIERWNPRKHATRCCGCGETLRRGDMVFNYIAVTIHEGCWELYQQLDYPVKTPTN